MNHPWDLGTEGGMETLAGEDTPGWSWGYCPPLPPGTEGRGLVPAQPCRGTPRVHGHLVLDLKTGWPLPRMGCLEEPPGPRQRPAQGLPVWTGASQPLSGQAQAGRVEAALLLSRSPWLSTLVPLGRWEQSLQLTG